MRAFGLPAALRGTLIVLGLCLALAQPASAESPEGHVRDLGAEAIRMLTDQAAPPQRREEDFRRLLAKGFDLDLISRFVLGRYWRQATEAQRAEYRQLFESFLVRSYSNRFNQYSGEQFEVRGARGLDDGDMLVQSLVQRPNGPPVRLDWRLRRSGDGWRIIDVVVEGISMAITQRQEFTAVIQRNGGQVEPLLAELRQRTGAGE